MSGFFLFCLSYLALIAAGRQWLLRHAGAFGRDPVLATATAMAVAPLIAGLSLFPFYWMGFTHSWLGFLPLILAGLALLWLGRSPSPAHTAILPSGPVTGPRPKLLDAALILLAGVLVVQGLSMPLIENDALEYFAVAHTLFQQGNFLNYPVLIPDPVSGLYASSTHPPAFHMALVWGMHLAGAETFLPVRIIVVASALATVMLVGRLVWIVDTNAARFAMILLLGSPLWLGMTVSYGVDALRIATATAAFAGVVCVINEPTRRAALVAGVLAGFALWSHSIGLIVPAFGGVALLLLLQGRSRLELSALYGVVAGLTGGFWYGVNIWRMGLPVADVWPAAIWPSLRFGEDQAMRRQLDGLSEMLQNGVLRVLTDPMLFGLVFWLAIMALFFWRTATLRTAVARAAGIFVMGFLVVALATVLLGTTLVIKNARYVLTFLPMAAVLAGLALTMLWNSNMRMARGSVTIVLFLTVLLALGSAVLRGAGLMHPAFVMGQEQQARQLTRYAMASLLHSLHGEGSGRILSFRSPDTAVYGLDPAQDHHDPGLLPFHAAAPSAMVAELRRRRVFAAITPLETPVTYTQSSLLHVLADPALAAPHRELRGARTWLLHKVDRAWTCEPFANLVATAQRSPISAGQRLAAFTGIPHFAALWPSRTIEDNPVVFPLAINWNRLENNQISMTLRAPLQGWFRFELRLAGKGLVRVSADLSDGTRLRDIVLFDGLIPLGGTIAAQYRPLENEMLLRLRLTGLRQTQAQLSDVHICKIILAK